MVPRVRPPPRKGSCSPRDPYRLALEAQHEAPSNGQLLGTLRDEQGRTVVAFRLPLGTRHDYALDLLEPNRPTITLEGRAALDRLWQLERRRADEVSDSTVQFVHVCDWQHLLLELPEVLDAATSEPLSPEQVTRRLIERALDDTTRTVDQRRALEEMLKHHLQLSQRPVRSRAPRSSRHGRRSPFPRLRRVRLRAAADR